MIEPRENGDIKDSATKDSELAAAHDFRVQQQARFAGRTTAELIVTIDDLDIAAMVAKFQIYMPEVTIESIENLLGSTVSLNTRLDEPIGHAILIGLAKDIERAATDLKMPLRSGVSLGAFHVDGMEAMQQPVMMTRGLLKFDLFRDLRKTRLLRTLHNRFVSFGWCFHTTEFSFFRWE